MIEPFGYFRAEPFGWTDCAETDEGAVALYDRAEIDEAYERAAVVCEAIYTNGDGAEGWLEIAANRIRALKGQP